MIKAVFAQKDATIYRDIPTINTGLDEILEIRKSLYKINQGTIAETAVAAISASISRVLIKFDLSDISSSLQNNTINTSPKYYLKLYTTNASRLQIDYTIEAYPISQSWTMGSGKKISNPLITDGVSWNYKISGSQWSGSFPATSSIQGATWYTTYSASQAFSYEKTDIDMDVTSIVNAWMSQSIPNEGFILKLSASMEQDAYEYGSINFFSRDTNTIYPPQLLVKWDDSAYTTASLSAVDTDSMTIAINNIKDKYKNSEVTKFNLLVRDRFPAKAYVTSSRFLIQKYLPSSSYYSVVDAHTNETLISFDSWSTKISCDGTNHYFKFDMSALQPERYYKFVLKVEDSGLTHIIDNNYYFKIEI